MTTTESTAEPCPVTSAHVGPHSATRLSTTVVICTYTFERWEEVCAAVESALIQSTTPDEVVVIADHNDELLHGLTARFAQRVTILPNTRAPGLSGARNSAVEYARTDVVAFLDDDAVADQQWLSRLVRPFSDPSVCVTGSRAEPRWPDNGQVPHFLPPELWWVVGCSYTGQPQHISDVRNVIGCGMVFRREVFDRVGDFNEHMGRIGKTPLGCEETELCIRLRRQWPQARVVFEPSAVLHHQVARDRVRWTYLVHRSYAEGLSKALVARLAGRAEATRTERDYVVTTLTKALRREVRNGRRGIVACVAILTCTTAVASGFLFGSLRLALARGNGRGGRSTRLTSPRV